MTEDAYNQALATGQVETVQPTADPVQQEEIKPLTLDEYQPVLEALRRVRNHLTAIPTFVPKSFADSIQFFDDGTNQKVYAYFNGAWQEIKANQAAPVWELVVNKVLGGSAATIDTGVFTAYKYLRFEFITQISKVNSIISMTLNNDASSLYEFSIGYTNGSTAGGASNNNTTLYQFNTNLGAGTADNQIFITCDINCAAGGFKRLIQSNFTQDFIDGVSTVRRATGGGGYRSTSDITRIILAVDNTDLLSAASVLNVYGHN